MICFLVSWRRSGLAAILYSFCHHGPHITVYSIAHPQFLFSLDICQLYYRHASLFSWQKSYTNSLFIATFLFISSYKTSFPTESTIVKLHKFTQLNTTQCDRNSVVVQAHPNENRVDSFGMIAHCIIRFQKYKDMDIRHVFIFYIQMKEGCMPIHGYQENRWNIHSGKKPYMGRNIKRTRTHTHIVAVLGKQEKLVQR